MTGSTEEQVLFVAHGTGSNGKSVFINVLRRVLGEYAKAVPPETLMARDRAGIPNDIARLAGVRFAPTVEVEDGKRFAESIVKQLTGGDAISARFLRQEFFDFVPVVKLWVATNHRPRITGTDHAIWRRILLIPFTVTIAPEKRDKKLEEKLMAEAPGILNWLRIGFRAWRRWGLAPPETVMEATRQYRADMDRIGLFLKECCKLGERKGPTRKTALYAAYKQWCEQSGCGVLSKPGFYDKLRDDHKLQFSSLNGIDVYRGLEVEDSL